MPLPTLNQLVIELQKHKVEKSRTIKLELLNKLELLDENNVDEFTVYLCNLLLHQDTEEKLKKILYRTSLVLGQLFPRNCLENGKVLDPILFEPIDPKHLFISLDRRQWSIVTLVTYFLKKNGYDNPTTGALFNQIDIEKMKSIARKSGLTIRLQSEHTASNNHTRRVNSTGMRDQLYNLFSSYSSNNNNNVYQAICPVPFAGGIVYYKRS